jgi:hypothetical protein
LDYILTPRQKADARAFTVLVEEELHLSLVRVFVLVCVRVVAEGAGAAALLVGRDGQCRCH